MSEQQNLLKKPAKQSSLLARLKRARTEFRTFKIELATDLHDRLEALSADTGLTKDEVNHAINYAVRGLITRLEREAKERKFSGVSKA